MDKKRIFKNGSRRFWSLGYNLLMRLSDVFGTVQAAEFLGIDPAALRVRIAAGDIEPIALGSRTGADGRPYPHGFAFTRRMLEEVRRGARPVVATRAEREQIFNTARAARFLGISISALKKRRHIDRTLPGKLVGRDTVFILDDLRAFADASGRGAQIDR